MTKVAIVGAGAIARAYAALLVRGGHAVALWSPSGLGARDLPRASQIVPQWPNDLAAALSYDGKVEGMATVALLHDPAGLASAEVVIVALPAPAYAAVLPRVAPQLRTGQTIFFSGALSLSPLWLAERAAADGQHPRVAASGTTVATARSREGGVVIMTIRTRLGVAAVPAAASGAAIATMSRLFGDRFDAGASVLAVTLSNINPVAHAAMALANFTRIERGEAWPQYHYLTPAVARLVEAMDGERRALALAFGLSVTTIEAHFQRSFDVPQCTLAEIAAELHRRRGGPPGPTSLATRFVLEDVPYGLVFNAALARIALVAVPVTEATVTMLSTLYGRDFRGDNPLVGELGLASATRESLLARCAGVAA
jgi:opine dehydrogenase